MSILARARSSNDSLGYATDFVSAMVRPNLQAIADSGVKLISNAVAAVVKSPSINSLAHRERCRRVAGIHGIIEARVNAVGHHQSGIGR